jgi:hypothetical protein
MSGLIGLELKHSSGYTSEMHSEDTIVEGLDVRNSFHGDKSSNVLKSLQSHSVVGRRYFGLDKCGFAEKNKQRNSNCRYIVDNVRCSVENLRLLGRFLSSRK